MLKTRCQVYLGKKCIFGKKDFVCEDALVFFCVYLLFAQRCVTATAGRETLGVGIQQRAQGQEQKARL